MRFIYDILIDDLALTSSICKVVGSFSVTIIKVILESQRWNDIES